MAETINEKTSAPEIGSATPSHDGAKEEGVITTGKRGAPWMYKTFKVGSWTFPGFATPNVQVILVSVVCFMCPGMYNAVTGLGAAGQVKTKDVDNATVALYATFAGVGFFAGSIANRIGLRLTLSFGGFGYFLYLCSILSYNHNQNVGFLIFAGAVLGLCAGLLWTAQGAVMMSYPYEKDKGRAIGWFWMIFNMGAVLGSLIPLGENLHKTAGAVSDGTYIAFIILMAFGFLLAWTLVDPEKVVRSDGSHVILMKNPTWKSEILALLETFKTDTYILLLFPMFFASNWFYTYQFNGINAAYFNTRTRALNGVLYYLMQIVGAWIFGIGLDLKVAGRRTKARVVLVVLFVLTMVIWGGGYAFEKTYTRASVSADDFKTKDFNDSGYIGPMFLYMFYGFFDAAWQTTVYWLMGAMTNNSRKLANFTGFYKGIQSAGAAIVWRLDAMAIPYLDEYASSWALCAAGLIFAAPVVWYKVRDTIPIEEDLKFSDETIEEVAPIAPEIKS
ncbi:hypothetical protein UCRPC4_g05105 [Phaeomoniella chlamydospora]|uniref:Duf895 domain membrane protein n=1 Tax=Phaeomoniella chlamydospora TaxID=158046 RepID=A0A0G2GMR3_PHACM|nr:hypothetical protein UCRPC4_g05105 [Phaeomoniella chlamydospora]